MPALEAAPASNNPAEGGADQSLPDPSGAARLALAVLLAAAIGVAVIMNAAGWTNQPFTPPKGDVNFTLLAGFYVGAQIIERLMELVAPLLPAWPPAAATGNVKAAHVKADRAKVALGVAAVLGVAASAGFGLFFLQVLGIDASHTIDSLVTGIVIAAGTKPLHDFITLLQKQNAPTTGTKVSA
jgi:hypothetical protein